MRLWTYITILDNTLSRFTNKLSPVLELDGEWEVALSEIFYPANILANTTKFEFVLMTADEYVLHKNNPQILANQRFDISFNEKCGSKLCFEAIQ